MRLKLFSLLLGFPIFFSVSCSPKQSPNHRSENTVGTQSISGTPPEKTTPLDSWERGFNVYKTNCISCHNIDPKKDGAVGPSVFGSSEALLRARIMTRGYPEGTKPKRPSFIMPEFPYLEKEIPALTAFLSQEKK